MRIRREELFRLVWEKPLSKLAPKLGISDRGLAKVCVRENIPLPPHGHFWELTNANGRIARQRVSACAAFAGTIAAMLNESATNNAIHERIRGMGFPGSRSAVTEYTRKILRHQKRVRTVKTRNRFGEFSYQQVRTPKPYEVQRPELPPGREWVTFGPGRTVDVSAYEPEDVPSVETDSVEQMPSAPGTLLESLGPELEYAKRADPELYVATWLEIGCDLPAAAYTQLTWENIANRGKGWIIQGLTKKPRPVALSAVRALTEHRRNSGKVLTNAHRTRHRIQLILGPRWKQVAHMLRCPNSPQGIATETPGVPGGILGQPSVN
jgi:hypothetical protein